MKDLKLIAKYIYPFKGHAILNIIFNLLSSFFTLFSFTAAIPFLGILFDSQKFVYDTVTFSFTDLSALEHNINYVLTLIITTKGKIFSLFCLGIVVIIFTLLKTLTWYLANHFMVYVRNGAVKNIRNNLFEKVISLPLSYFSEEKKGNIISRMSNDVQEIEYGIMSSLEMIFRDPLRIVIYLSALLYLSWQLTVFVVILLPMVGILISISGKKLRGSAKKGQNQIGILMSQIEEMISGLRIVKAFNGENHFYKRFVKTNNEYTKTQNYINRLRFMASPLTEFLSTVAVVIIMWFGGKMIIEGKGSFSPQALIGYLVIFSQIIVPGKAITTAWYNIKKAMASVDRINEILDATNNITDNQGNIVIDSFKNQIEFKNVFFSYSDIPVLTDINLTINKGDKIAIVGQSGSGKSSLVDLIPRFYDVVSGEIFIDGNNIKNYTIKSLRSQIGYVSQQPILFNDTIFNNIAFGINNVAIEDVIRAAKIANAHQFIMETENGYDTNIGDGGCRLSGGQRQRLSIARAVLKNPNILIFDEATSALDSESEKQVQDALENLMKSRTSIIIAHRLSSIKNANMICVIDNNSIVEKGTHEELLQNKKEYYKLYYLQNS